MCFTETRMDETRQTSTGSRFATRDTPLLSSCVEGLAPLPDAPRDIFATG